MLGRASLGLLAAVQGARNLGKIGLGAVTGKYGTTVAGATIGGLYGLVSDDTSVLGGAAIGAGIGRYGVMAGKGFRSAMNSNMGIMAGIGRGLSYTGRLAARDARGVRIAANRGMNRISSTMKSWGSRGESFGNGAGI